jgi:diguanylate cyclase (GGDEF)-like protein/PAS domain S-box-containing protein
VSQIAETVLQAAGIGGWELDVAIGRVTWTAITFQVFELDPPDAPPVADTLAFYPPEARPVVQAAVQAAIDTGTPWDIETPLVTARGRHGWVRSWGLAVQENGRTVRLVGAFQDVTDRHRLNARTERLSVVASQMTNIIITTDRSGHIDWVNAALTGLTGYTLAEALGRKPGDLLQGPRTDPATVAVMARGIRDGTGFDVDIVNYTKAGVAHWMSMTCSPLRELDGTVNGFIAVQADISARRAAEDTARAEAAERERAELLLRDVLETLPMGVSVFDAGNRFVLANRAYREMFPIAASFLAVGRPLEALMRLAVEHGQYGDVPADEAGREAWIARHMDYFRSPTGIARTLDMADGRVMQVRERRSDTGMLVSVRADMTDLHTAEANARREAAERGRAEALLQDVLDALPNAITAYDSDDRLVMSNHRYAEMFPITARFAVPGRAHAEIIRLAAAGGQYDDAPAEPAARDAWLAQLLGYFRDGTTHELRLPDGRVAEVRESRSQTGNRVIVHTDITDLKRAEARARAAAAERERADALLRDVLDAVPSAIVAYDQDERLVVTNPADGDRASLPPALFALGERLEDVMRLAVAHGYFLDAPVAPAEYEAWIAQLLAHLRDPAGAPRTMHLSDGRTVLVSARRSESGNLVIIRTDITDLLRAQALLRDVLDALPSAVVAYDADERIILANQALAEMVPMLTGVTAVAMRLSDVLRLGADEGYFADLPALPEEQEVWLAQLLAFFRHDGGVPRTLRVRDGHSVQVRSRRSATGNLVVVSTDITDLVGTQALLRDVMDVLPSAVVAYDSDEHVILFNRAHAELAPSAASFTVAGGRLEEAVRLAAELGYFADSPAAPAAREAWLGSHLSYLRDSGGIPRTTRLANGHTVQVRTLRSQTGNLVIVRTDITDLVAAQALLRDVMDALPSAVIAYDRDERLVLWNRASTNLLPESASFAAVGRTLEEMVRFSAASGAYLDAGTTEADHDRWVAARLAAYRASGSSRTLRLRDGRFLNALERRSESGNLVCVRTDTTDLKRAEEHLRWQAERDPLTQLHNRNFFLTALDEALAAVANSTAQGATQGMAEGPVQGKDDGGVLLLLDIDYFKQINDTLGHDMGDALLVEIAARLRLYLRGDAEGAARLGGDEFGVVIPGLVDPGAAMARVDGLHAALSAPADLGGRRTPIGISMGVTLFPADATDATKLLKNADLALYEAKRTGRGRWAQFRPEQATSLERHVRMADALREALSRHQFTVALQPKRRLRDGAHAGFEALARWHDGTDWVPPREFIPVAEDSGLIRPLGRVVMAAAFARIREIRDRGLEPGRVALNVTGPQLLDPHFREQTLAALGQHGLGPADLELELTGTALFGRAAEQIDGVVRDMSDLGITLALDDFGTGYSSLAHLSRLPIDRLKIDRSFVGGTGRGGAGGVLARAVIGLAHSLEMEAIGKGVETAEQMAFLAAAGCDVVQGYLISWPLLTTAEAVAYLGSPHDLCRMAH